MTDTDKIGDFDIDRALLLLMERYPDVADLQTYANGKYFENLSLPRFIPAESHQRFVQIINSGECITNNLSASPDDVYVFNSFYACRVNDDVVLQTTHCCANMILKIKT